MSLSPTARTLAWLRKNGYTAEVVERYNQYSKTRHDLFGWCDIVAVGPPCHWLGDADPKLMPKFINGIQCTSGSNHAARVEKAHPLSADWRTAGGLAYVVSWSRKGPRGKRKTWQVRVEAL